MKIIPLGHRADITAEKTECLQFSLQTGETLLLTSALSKQAFAIHQPVSVQSQGFPVFHVCIRSDANM